MADFLRKRPYKEHKVKSLQELIDYLDNVPANETPKSPCDDLPNLKVLNLNGSEIDALTVINRYGLQYADEGRRDYKSCLFYPQVALNTYCVGPVSMYGHIPFKLNVKGQCVYIIKNSKSNYEHCYKSQVAENLVRENKYVVLDIETTGLKPIADDIIQIAVYDSEQNYYVRYLPLENQKTNSAVEINGIPDDNLRDKRPLTQDEVDSLIEQFDLDNSIVAIWTSNNLFDRCFLEAYFSKHNLKGIERITFFNSRKLLDSNGIYMLYAPKDEIARAYGIDTSGSHDALNDARIQHEIVENLLNKNVEPIIAQKEYEAIIAKTKSILRLDASPTEVAELYYAFCDVLKKRNGIVFNDYDQFHLTRGKEWIDIHHIDEIIEDNIATKTNNAKKENNFIELERLKAYNRSDRLVYANKVEHFLLHCLLDIMNPFRSGGPHWLFGSLMKAEIGLFEQGTVEYSIQQRLGDFFDKVTFDDIKKIYSVILKKQQLKFVEAKRFYKLDTYQRNRDKYNEIMFEIRRIMKTMPE